MPIAVPVRVVRRPLREALQWAAELRVAGVMLDARQETPPHEFGDSACRHLLQLLNERQLQIAALDFPLRYPLYETPALDACLAAIREVLLLAERLKVRALMLRPGRIPEAQAPARSRLTEILRDLALAAGRRGVMLTLTCSADTPATVRSLFAELPEGLAALDLDPAGLILNQRSPVTASRELHDLLGHVQLRDARRDEDGTGVETELGQGETPWAELFAQLHEANYRGWMTIRRTQGESPTADVEAAAIWLRRFVMPRMPGQVYRT